MVCDLEAWTTSQRPWLNINHHQTCVTQLSWITSICLFVMLQHLELLPDERD